MGQMRMEALPLLTTIVLSNLLFKNPNSSNHRFNRRHQRLIRVNSPASCLSSTLRCTGETRGIIAWRRSRLKKTLDHLSSLAWGAFHGGRMVRSQRCNNKLSCDYHHLSHTICRATWLVEASRFTIEICRSSSRILLIKSLDLHRPNSNNHLPNILCQTSGAVQL